MGAVSTVIFHHTIRDLPYSLFSYSFLKALNVALEDKLLLDLLSEDTKVLNYDQK